MAQCDWQLYGLEKASLGDSGLRQHSATPVRDVPTPVRVRDVPLRIDYSGLVPHGSST